MPRCFRSIQAKIQLAITLTSTCVLLILAALLVFTQYTSSRRELVQNLQTLAQLSANSVAAPLVFGAPEEGQDVLLSLNAVPGLHIAAVLRPDGSVFVHRSFDGEPLPSLPVLPEAGDDHLWLADRIIVTAPIELAGQQRGIVWLDCGLEHFKSRIRGFLLWCIYLYLMATALAALAAWLLQHLITRPILELAQVADRTIQEGPSSVRAHKRGDDEIGTLVDSFNHMLDHISRQNEELRDREHCYRTLFAQAASAYLLEDENRRVVEANQSAATLFSQPEADLIGRSTAELFAVDSLPGPSLGERVQIARTEARLRDGRTVPVELAVTGITYGGKNLFMTSATDITDRLRAQELLVRSRDELQERVNAATAELREANDSLQREMDERRRLERQMMMSEKLKGLGHMAGGIAHDFNNLLQTILGNADFLLAEELNDEGLHCVQEIRRAGRAAAGLASQMLAYAGKNALCVAPLQVNDLILSMQPLLEAAVAKNARASYELGADLPLIDADEGQLQQVIMNLVTNAAESLPPEGGTYTIRTGSCHCDQEFLSRALLHEDLPVGRYLFLAVQDTGCGIEPSMIERIFDPFFSTKFAGRGLGLAGVLGIVRAHHATITVDSMPGKGSTFTVYFPAIAASPVFTEEETPTAPDWRGEGLVLVADDEEGVRHVAKRMFQQLGFEVELAENGTRAIEFCRLRHQDVRLYILDVTMPGIGGVETARQILAIAPDARVVLTSAYGVENIQSQIGGLRIFGFLRKPYVKDTLRDQLASILD